MIVWNLVSSCLTILPIAEWCYYKWELISTIHKIIEQANFNIRAINKYTLVDDKIERINAALERRPHKEIDKSFWIEEIKYTRIASQEDIAAETKKYNKKSLITKPLGVLGFVMLASGKLWQIYMQN